MTFNTTAIYENGLLRLPRPLDVPEGTAVNVQVVHPQPKPSHPESEIERRIMAAKSMEEAYAIASEFPDNDPEYNVIKEMNETRRQAGSRLLIPDVQ